MDQCDWLFAWCHSGDLVWFSLTTEAEHIGRLHWSSWRPHARLSAFSNLLDDPRFWSMFGEFLLFATVFRVPHRQRFPPTGLRKLGWNYTHNRLPCPSVPVSRYGPSRHAVINNLALDSAKTVSGHCVEQFLLVTRVIRLINYCDENDYRLRLPSACNSTMPGNWYVL